jgi:hypothetical protein
MPEEPAPPTPNAPRRTTPPLQNTEPMDPVEESDLESFPASDAPGWSPVRPGPPARQGRIGG